MFERLEQQFASIQQEHGAVKADRDRLASERADLGEWLGAALWTMLSDDAKLLAVGQSCWPWV